jgi:hypothetical protein
VPKLVLSCEMSDVLRNQKESEVRGHMVKDKECPFRLCGYLLKPNEWSLIMVNGVHNYQIESESSPSCW